MALHIPKFVLYLSSISGQNKKSYWVLTGKDEAIVRRRFREIL